MQVGGDYAKPVMVNGFACNNCEDVSAAKRGLDPVKQAPGVSAEASSPAEAVVFGGSQAERPRGINVAKMSQLVNRLV